MHTSDLAWVIGGRLLTAVSALVSIRLMSSVLTPIELGSYSVLMALVTLACLTLVNPVDQLMNKRIHAWLDDGSLLSRLRVYRKYVLTCAVLGGGFSIAWLRIGTSSRHDIAAMLQSAAIVGFMIATSSIALSQIFAMNMLGLRKHSTLTAAIGAVLAPAFSIVAVELYPSGKQWILGQAFAYAIAAFYGYRLLSRGTRCFERQTALADRQFSLVRHRSDILSFCFPIALSTLLLWFESQGYRLLVERYWGAAELAMIFAGATIAAQAWSMVESVAMQYFFPYMFRRAQNRRTSGDAGHAITSEAGELVNLLGPAYLVILAFGICSAPVLVQALLSQQYQEAFYYVAYGMLWEYLRASANLFNVHFQLSDSTRRATLPFVIGNGFLLGIFVAGAKLGAALVVPVGLSVAWVFTFTLSWWQARNIGRIQLFSRHWQFASLVCVAGAVAYFFCATSLLTLSIWGALASLFFLSLSALTAVYLVLWLNPIRYKLQVALSKPT